MNDDPKPTTPVTSTQRRSVALSFRDACVEIGGRSIWRDVNLEIHEGEFAAILGPNGVGKSTLVKVALGMQGLHYGEVRVLGAPPGATRQQIGYLPQRRSFDPSLRVRGVDIVRFGLDGSKWGLPLPRRLLRPQARDALRRVDDVIETVGASAFAERPIGQLSGGEQQRLLIAQALIQRPRMLFLDEPLDSLDLPNQGAITALIHQISSTEGVTVVMVAHDVNPILAYLDQVIYIGPGGAISGTPREVITSESLTRLFKTPIEVLTTSDGRLVVVGQPDAPAFHHDRHTHDGSEATTHHHDTADVQAHLHEHHGHETHAR